MLTTDLVHRVVTSEDLGTQGFEKEQRERKKEIMISFPLSLRKRLARFRLGWVEPIQRRVIVFLSLNSEYVVKYVK